ncbi:MAG: SRPBCC family protein [Deltaproteobacteria bacterium]|nr:SRPBCC family protein [Deltaproteobacteria bacterium]
MPRIERSMLLRASPEQCYNVIADIESYPRFLPTIKAVNILRKGKGWCEATFTVDLLKRLEYTVRVSFSSPSEVRWTLVKGDMMTQNDGGWMLSPEGKGKTKATYSMDVAFSTWIPQTMVASVVASGLPDMFERFQKRIEKGLKKR